MPKVLILAASPIDQDRLRLNSEVKEIRNSLQRSRNRENWQIESNEAATVDDFRRALLDHRPAVVHFAGHGHSEGGLCFENSEGGTHSARIEPLAKLLHLFKEDLKCVVLNACYSEVQAEEVRKEIDYVIGMKSTVRDDAATKFAIAFYDAIFAGTDFRVAFDIGCAAIDLDDLPGQDTPTFLTAAHLNSVTLAYSSRVPELERFIHSYSNTEFLNRAPFIIDGEAALPKLKMYYGDRIHSKVDAVHVLGVQHLEDSFYRVAAELRARGASQQYIYYVKIQDRSIAIDWDATTGHWSVPVRTYLAQGAHGEVMARVTAELDTYYNYSFNDDKARHYQSVRLSTPSHLPGLHGYVRRNSPEYSELISILADGNEHDVTLAISNVGDPSTSRIERMLSKTWIYQPPVIDGE